MTLVINSPVMSCCGKPANECTCNPGKGPTMNRIDEPLLPPPGIIDNFEGHVTGDKDALAKQIEDEEAAAESEDERQRRLVAEENARRLSVNGDAEPLIPPGY